MSDHFISSHSAEVAMWLDCGEHGTLHLARVTPNTVVAKQPRDIPPCFADLLVEVDGELMRNRVNLVAGYSAKADYATAIPVDGIPF